jgi:hypothetical protein
MVVGAYEMCPIRAANFKGASMATATPIQPTVTRSQLYEIVQVVHHYLRWQVTLRRYYARPAPLPSTGSKQQSMTKIAKSLRRSPCTVIRRLSDPKRVHVLQVIAKRMRVQDESGQWRKVAIWAAAAAPLLAVLTTVDIIRAITGRYFCDYGMLVKASGNAAVGRTLAKMANESGLLEKWPDPIRPRPRDDGGHQTTSAGWRFVVVA